MDKPMPDWYFKGMAFLFRIRDLFCPRDEILRETEITAGSRVLDFGCGPGSYTMIAAKLVGPTGKIYALDIHPLAIQHVRDSAAKQGLTNIGAIQSDCATRLPAESMDVVLLYDIFHMFSEPNNVLTELHRVLKPSGSLSFSDHHMEDDTILSGVTANGLFKLARKGKHTYTFIKQKRSPSGAVSPS